MGTLKNLFLYCLSLALVLLWPHTSSADSSDRCARYDTDVERSVKTYWNEWPEWIWWRAQIKAESGCNPDAQSGVGAKGLAQVMDGTWRDLLRLQGVPGAVSPFDARMSIELGAVYQGRARRGWGAAGRSNKQRNDLGLCSYNRGLGNCLRDQKECDSATLWDDIAPCTAIHTLETVNYVRRINQYHQEMNR